MTQDRRKPTPNEQLVKFYTPVNLKQALQELAVSRNIALSALLRLIVSEYVRNQK